VGNTLKKSPTDIHRSIHGFSQIKKKYFTQSGGICEGISVDLWEIKGKTLKISHGYTQINARIFTDKKIF